MRKRNFLVALGILSVGILLSFGPSLLRTVANVELLHAPEFDDVSAFNESDIEQIDTWLQEQVALGKFPSLSVAIVSDDKIVYQGAFGYEDIKAGTKVTPDTSYRRASDEDLRRTRAHWSISIYTHPF